MTIKRIVLICWLTGFGPITSAQTVIPEVRIEPLAPMPRVIYRPLLSDSTLLFFSPDLVWRCSYTNVVVGLDWFTADFAWVKECTCRKETYRLIPYGGGYPGYHYELTDSLLMGSLVRTSDTTFNYTEVKDHRTIPLVFDLSKVIRVDTMYYESASDINLMKMDVTRFVELKKSN